MCPVDAYHSKGVYAMLHEGAMEITLGFFQITPPVNGDGTWRQGSALYRRKMAQGGRSRKYNLYAETLSEPGGSHPFGDMSNQDLNTRFDSKTVHNIDRPDVQVTLGLQHRLIAAMEIKRFWAGRVDTAKDQARVISATIHYLKKDAIRHHVVSSPPVRMAIWMPGDEIYAYEVIGYPDDLFLAVQVARFRVPMAIREDTVGLTTEALGWFAAIMLPIKKIGRIMLADQPITQ
ncbi:hypothetical protein HDU89_004089 [Geranomyces variabilis]|nr:hypothetical protein HDU89_004089 [Geranomyces variabilis]